MANRQRRDLIAGLGFLAPNILGFVTFILGPLVFSLALAFTNWDFRLHNMFKDEQLNFVLLKNFARLLHEPDFWKYLGNTLFLMMAIPFGIAGSLCAALLLSQDTSGGSKWVYKWLIATAGLVFGMGCLVLVGTGASAMTIFICGLAGLVLVGGTAGGTTVYRTLFFMPHFTSGVATFILWKKLYNPSTGPISTGLRPVLDAIAAGVNALPAGGVQACAWVLAFVMLGVFYLGARNFSAAWRDGEMGWFAVGLSTVFLGIPALFAVFWDAGPQTGRLVAVGALLLWLLTMGRVAVKGREFPCGPDDGLGSGIMLGGVLMVAQFTVLGLGNLLFQLPDMALDGLEPPEWLTQYDWAKPSIMFMGLWAAIGSNNMLLYLAGLSNVPGELYEAAEIDGGRLISAILARDLATAGPDHILHHGDEHDRRPAGRFRDGSRHDRGRPGGFDDDSELLRLQRGLRHRAAGLCRRHFLGSVRPGVCRNPLQLEVRQPPGQRLK